MSEKIGLVTITFNSEPVIREFLHSISTQDYLDFTLYVVDNDSKDKTIEIIESEIGEIGHFIIKNNFNNGIAGGNNQGIKKALEDGCDYIVLINNDVEFEATLLSKLINKAKSAGYYVVVPKMMYYNEPDVLWYAGGFFIKRMGYINYHVGFGEKDENQYGEREVAYAPTCCALIHREVFENIGLMDEKYFAYFDDSDFFFRLMKNGRYKVLYINNVEFYHKVGSLTKSMVGTRVKFKFSDFVIKYTTRNRVYYLKKQKSLLAYLNIGWFLMRINLRFFFSGKYTISFEKWLLLQKSFFEGLAL
jgi:GT2 family glycosyltransferase